MDFSSFIKPEALESIDLEQSPIGFCIHTTVLHFNNSFIQSGKDLLDNFIKEHSGVKKWILSPDYAFYDSNKKTM
ncbi:MAG: hypothetical protein ACMZI0_10550 [Symbiopectobacterium sp.]|uniref:hypothetical protein n=1 Tax=Symbiopectobacterium sp. TaxID=2952789 RepID=UPI0039ED2965